jgi:hypothetical protein
VRRSWPVLTPQVSAGDVTAARASLEAAYRAGFKGPDLYLGLGYLAHLGSDTASAIDWFTCALSADTEEAAGGAATKYVEDSLPRLYLEMGLTPTVFTFDKDGEPAGPLSAEARAGPTAAVGGGRLVISGTQKDAEGRRTRVVLPTDGALFRSAAADLELAGLGLGWDSTTTAGLLLESHTGSVEIATVPQARIRVRFRDGQKAAWQDWRELMELPPRRDRVRLSISMLETGKNLARLELRARAVPPAHAESPATRVIELRNAFWRERAFSIVIFASSPKDETVRAVVDNLVLVEQARR